MVRSFPDTILGTGIRVYFPALKSALIDQPKTPNRHGGGLSGGIDDTITVSAIAESLGIPKRTIEREMKRLRDSEHIIREGGNRYGHLKINKKD